MSIWSSIVDDRRRRGWLLLVGLVLVEVGVREVDDESSPQLTRDRRREVPAASRFADMEFSSPKVLGTEYSISLASPTSLSSTAELFILARCFAWIRDGAAICNVCDCGNNVWIWSCSVKSRCADLSNALCFGVFMRRCL